MAGRGPLGGVAAGVPGRVPVLAAIARLGRTAPAGRVAGSGLPSWWPCHGLSFPRSRVHQRPLRAAGRSELYTRQKAPSAINDRHPARRVERTLHETTRAVSSVVRVPQAPGGLSKTCPGPEMRCQSTRRKAPPQEKSRRTNKGCECLRQAKGRRHGEKQAINVPPARPAVKPAHTCWTPRRPAHHANKPQNTPNTRHHRRSTDPARSCPRTSNEATSRPRNGPANPQTPLTSPPNPPTKRENFRESGRYRSAGTPTVRRAWM